MHRRGSNNRLAGLIIRTRISTVMLAMIATMASVYVAGRLWQDAENRVYLIKELDRRTGQGQSAVSVDDTLKVIACREQHKRLSYLETELAAARQEGFISKHKPETNGNHTKRPLLVVGVLTGFGSKNRRNAIRKAWSTHVSQTGGIQLRDMAVEVHLFLDEDNHVEAPEELSKKTKRFFVHAADTWDAEFYAKVNDDVYVNIDALRKMLESHLDKPRAYIGCMKSGEVFSEPNHKWYEPDWWKFGDGKSYFRHASGEIYVISQAVAQFVSINRSILRSYAHDDVTVGSWLIGLDVKHIDEAKLCCSSWSSVADSKISD
ncbi:putative beta-1,3-galactosyltransferase 11 [Acorus calamus]|uniref:Hexosyltransferase n=1 Tax=Acorus calamus TaxID=4465 RepID=A0AAV9C043_ACOCL|nr:putative beta-1,3-galactosyltransferase 11 [Acorus calamus]